ncbi:MAG: hypothetical protein OEY34_07845, partial [Cyclobacteriaceae bacterium]|nr:hypothetical protein [Cyclobacteriaceae bacterium]
NTVVNLDNPNTKIFSGGIRDGYEASVTMENYPISSYFGYDIIGIFESASEVTSSPSQPGADVGRWKFRDVNGDNQIDGDDRVVLGSPHPDFTLGIPISVQYKNFDFNIFIQGVYGRELFNANKYFTDMASIFETSQKGANVLKSYGFNGTTASEALLPALSSTPPEYEVAPNSYYVEDGSYTRFKQLTIGYNFTSSTLSKIGFNNARIYLQGNNILTFTNYTGIDPEVGNGNNYYGGGADLDIGVDRGQYPIVKSYTAGVSFTF